jgi:hypothetical protein
MAHKKPPILAGAPKVAKYINPGTVSGDRYIPKPESSETNKWSFGFQYFSQIRYFEIGGVANSWYISLIDRLKEVSQINREKFLNDFSQHGNIRYHKIDWNSKNTPIKRADLNWIDKDILDNEDEFPMLQFHISKALGRVVGFWDEKNIFQIVLLDPKHNIQPSNYNSYHVDDTYFMSCEYSSLLIDIDKIKNKVTPQCTCPICIEIKKVPSKLNNSNFVCAYLDNPYIEKLDSTDLSLTEIIELGLLSS